MNEEKKSKFVKAGVTIGAACGIIVCFFVAGMMIGANTFSPVLMERKEVFQAVQIISPLGAEGTLGAGASGFLSIYFMNLSDYTEDGYGLNTSSTHETWSDANMPTTTPNAWANADEFDIESFASETTFVIMVRCRFNDTHAKDGADWFGTDTDVQITVACTSWAVGSNIANASGTMNETSNDSAFTFFYANWVWDNSATGYQISDDAVMTISEIYIEARF